MPVSKGAERCERGSEAEDWWEVVRQVRGVQEMGGRMGERVASHGDGEIDIEWTGAR